MTAFSNEEKEHLLEDALLSLGSNILAIPAFTVMGHQKTPSDLPHDS